MWKKLVRSRRLQEFNRTYIVLKLDVIRVILVLFDSHLGRQDIKKCVKKIFDQIKQYC